MLFPADVCVARCPCATRILAFVLVTHRARSRLHRPSIPTHSLAEPSTSQQHSIERQPSRVKPHRRRPAQRSDVAIPLHVGPYFRHGMLLCLFTLTSFCPLVQSFGFRDGLPGTPFHRSMQARSRIEAMVYPKIVAALEDPQLLDGETSTVARIARAVREEDNRFIPRDTECAPRLALQRARIPTRPCRLWHWPMSRPKGCKRGPVTSRAQRRPDL